MIYCQRSHPVRVFLNCNVRHDLRRALGDAFPASPTTAFQIKRKLFIDRHYMTPSSLDAPRFFGVPVDPPIVSRNFSSVKARPAYIVVRRPELIVSMARASSARRRTADSSTIGSAGKGAGAEGIFGLLKHSGPNQNMKKDNSERTRPSCSQYIILTSRMN